MSQSQGPKSHFSKKFNLPNFITHPVRALRNLNNKTSFKGCGTSLCTYKYPFCGIVLPTSDVALKNRNVRMTDLWGLTVSPHVVKGLIELFPWTHSIDSLW